MYQICRITHEETYPQVCVELVQNLAHGSSQVAHIRGLLVQSVLEDLKVLHPLHGEAVVDDVGLQHDRTVGDGTQKNKRATQRRQQDDDITLFMTTMKGSLVL